MQKLRGGGADRGISKRQGETGGLMHTGALSKLWLQSHKMYQISLFKHLQFIINQLYLSKALKKKRKAFSRDTHIPPQTLGPHLLTFCTVMECGEVGGGRGGDSSLA